MGLQLLYIILQLFIFWENGGPCLCQWGYQAPKPFFPNKALLRTIKKLASIDPDSIEGLMKHYLDWSRLNRRAIESPYFFLLSCILDIWLWIQTRLRHWIFSTQKPNTSLLIPCLFCMYDKVALPWKFMNFDTCHLSISSHGKLCWQNQQILVKHVNNIYFHGQNLITSR